MALSGEQSEHVCWSGPPGRLHARRSAVHGINGGPQFPFTEAISFVIDCEDQAEVDRLWNALTEGGGSPGQCGWLKDRYGVSWQIIPRQLGEMMSDPDRERAGRAMEAMLRMTKIDIAALRRAFEGKPIP